MSIEDELSRTVKKISENQDERLKRENLDRRKKLITGAYSEAARYNNIVLGLGYAAYFTMLSAQSRFLEELVVLGSGALVLLSLTIFVAFEVYKLVLRTLIFKRHSRGLTTGISDKQLDAIDVANSATAQQVMAIWPYVITPAVLSGFGGAIWLAYAVLERLVCILLARGG